MWEQFQNVIVERAGRCSQRILESLDRHSNELLSMSNPGGSAIGSVTILYFPTVRSDKIAPAHITQIYEAAAGTDSKTFDDQITIQESQEKWMPQDLLMGVIP